MKYYPGDTVRDIATGKLSKVVYSYTTKLGQTWYRVRLLYTGARGENKTDYKFSDKINLVRRPILNHIKAFFW